MQNKQNTKAKVIVIAIAILLCLALAVGITGAWYQAQRRATGTVKMDKGIVIDYTGFGKEADGIWIRENETTFRLFSDSDVQPGEKISLESAGIKANVSSVDFYARVKLSYEFYNGETKLETLPASFKASDLITTSATFFGSDWVDSGAGDGYYYYATGTTLNKFTKAAPAGFVDLFDTNARFIIEGAGFTGAENGGEGGGFVVGDASINKIVVYLTLETLQGDATAEQAQALGWEIIASAGDVVFADATAKLETSVDKVETTENLNVSVGGAPEVPLNEVVFPYDTTTTLKFDSNNVEYVTLTYSNGESETFTEAAANSNTYEVYANSSKGTVTAYTVGLFSDSEYTGFTFSQNILEKHDSAPNLNGGYCVAGYFGTDANLTIPSNPSVRKRDFKILITFNNLEECASAIQSAAGSIQFPCKVNGVTCNNFSEFINWYGENIESATDETFALTSPLAITNEIYVEYSGLFSQNINVVAIGSAAIMKSEVTQVTLPNTIKYICEHAFQGSGLTSIEVPSSVELIGSYAFDNCSNLSSITINNVTTINSNAFSNCTSLTTITLPSSLTTMGEMVFSGCSMLESVRLNSTSVVAISNSKNDFFDSCSALQNIFVPSDLVDSYKADSNWSALADKIQAIA